MNTRSTLATLVASLCIAGAACAQTATTGTAPSSPAAQKPGLLSRVLHRGASPIPNRPPANRPPAEPPIKGMAGVTGTIIGNKKTLVYHLPTDHNLPAPKNRMYFKTVAAAQAAGYHIAGAPMAHTSAAKKPAMHAYPKPTVGVAGH